MIRPSRLTQATTFLAGLTLVLSACSDGTNGTGPMPGNTTPLTQAEAQQVGQEMRDEASGFARGASLADMLAPSFEMPLLASSVFLGPRSFSTPPGCATLSENPPTDADGDGVPDNLTITYDSTACTFTSFDGSAVFSKSGTIHVVDPSQTVRRAIRFEFGALKSTFVFNDTIFFVRQLDGVTQLVADSSGYSAVDSTTVHRESSRFGTADISKRWVVTFTADPGQFFSYHSEPPSGDLNIQGTTSRSRSGSTRTFAVATTTPLHFDSTCSADDRIVSGELDVTYATPDAVTTIVVTWNGCGVEPTVTTTTGVPA